MSSTKPLDVVVLPESRGRNPDNRREPYREYKEKSEASSNNWSCYILAKEAEMFSVRCANTTTKLLVVQISVDSCCIQQYLLRPKGQPGDTVICRGTGSHSMMFHLVSGKATSLTRVVTKHARPPSEAGRINVVVYSHSGAGNGLPPPKKSMEQLELPVSMEGTFCKLCVRLTGEGMAMGEPSPHATEIGAAGWKKFASLNFNYRTRDELFSGRIRGVGVPEKQTSSPETSVVLSPIGKRKRDSLEFGTPQKRRDMSPFDTMKSNTSTSSTPSQSGSYRGLVDPFTGLPWRPRDSSSMVPRKKKVSPPPEGSSWAAVLASSDEPAAADPRITPRPSSSSDSSDDSLMESTSQPLMKLPPSSPPVLHTTEPITEGAGPMIPIELAPPPPPPQPQPPQSQPQHSVVMSTITPPPTPQDYPELEKFTATSIDKATAFTTFLDSVSSFRLLGISTKELQEAGISTLTEIKVIARNAEAFREKISVLADLRERDQYLWMMLLKGMKKLLEGEHHGKKSASDSNLATDPIGEFVHSLHGGECIDSEALANGLRGAGILSGKDLLVLSRNLKRYTEKIPFLQEFAATKKFGWVVFQVGLEGLPGQKISPSAQVVDRRTPVEGHEYVKHFLDTIDPDKPLGHLAGGFVKAGLNDRIPLLHVAEDIEFAVCAMPFFQELASGDQLVWAMIVAGLENLMKST